MLTVREKLLVAINSLEGIKEIPGSINNPVVIGMIRKYFKETTDEAKVAWCGILMAVLMYLIGRSDLIPKQPYRARNWANVGRKISLSEVQKGDIIVSWRGKSIEQGLGHVALYDGEGYRKGLVKQKGGNQSNGINTAHRSIASIIAVITFD